MTRGTLPPDCLLPEDERVIAARTHWQHTGKQRPAFAEATVAGEESVWDFPRPPIAEPVEEEVRVCVGEQVIARSLGAVRVLETAGAPTYYLPPQDVDEKIVIPGAVTSLCEWKGLAQELHVSTADRQIEGAGWRYVRMFPAFAELFEWPSFYPNKVTCYVGEERVAAQPGGYYGGWVTSRLKGPIKGEPGSSGW